MEDFDGLSFDEWLDRESRALAEEENEEQPEDQQVYAAAEAEPAPPRRPAPQRPAPPPGRPPKRRSGNLMMKILIPVAVLLAMGVIVLAVGFTYADRVSKITTIYPNVNVNGVDVGGMTMEQAAAVLGDAPDRYDNAAVTVNFPTGDSVTVTAQDLGLQPIDGTGFAQAAYSYGRTGTMLTNLMDYRACESGPVYLQVDSAQTNTIDRSVIEAMAAPVAQEVNRKLSTTQAQVSDTQIALEKNTGARGVDLSTLVGQIADAFEREDYTPIEYDTTQLSQTDGANASMDTETLLQTLYERIHVEPVNATYDPVTGTATESVTGVSFDMDQARQLWNETAEGGSVVIPLIHQEPEVTQAQLTERLFADVLAEKSTSLSGSSYARINNITLAAKAMNGTVIQPGAEFGYNDCLGQRTTAKGYQEAGAYSNGKHSTAVGGGICQGSSTLYYCCLYANLDITLRYDHYFTVTYLPMGLDATVSWGGPDFKFRNSRNYPIKIEAWVSNGSLTVRLLGTNEDGSYVKMTSDTWEDADFYYAQTYRNVYDANGNLMSSSKEAYSRYHKHEDTTETETAAAPVQNTTANVTTNSGGGDSSGGSTQTEAPPPAAPDPVPGAEPEPEPVPEPESEVPPVTDETINA